MLKCLVLLDVIFQMRFARRRLYWALRANGDLPDTANLRIFAIIHWWSKRSTFGWLLIALLSGVGRELAGQFGLPAAEWWASLLFTTSIFFGTATAIRLVGVASKYDLRSYLMSHREPMDMVDGPIQ